jgi:hypothetical protein
MTVKKIRFGCGDPAKKRGVFAAITAVSRIYEGYEDPSMSAEDKQRLYPLVLMMQRWDGTIGFVGGFTDGRNPMMQLVDEIYEELGMRDVKASDFEPLVSHEAEDIIVDLYRCNVGKGPTDVIPVRHLRRVIEGAAMAKHSISEGAAFWAHLVDYGRGRGFPALRRSSLATAVGEELDVLFALVNSELHR